MQKQIGSTNSEHILADENITRLLIRLSAPATIGMITMALYNLVDSIFVGRAVGPLGIAGISIVFPFQMLVLALGQLVGVGGASIVARSLGAGNKERANRTLGNLVSLSIIFGIIIAGVGLILLDHLLIIFGATDNILPYARDYMKIILIGSLFFISLISSNNLIRAEGRARIAMGTMIVSSLINIVLDPIFIFWFKMGIKGAALATVIAQAVTVIYIICYFISGKSSLNFRLKNLAFYPDIIREKFAIGISAFARMSAGSFLIIIINNSLGIYGGDLAIAAFGVIHRLLRFTIMPIVGITHGMQPITGFNYGAKRWKNAWKSVKVAIVAATIVSTCGFLLLFSIPSLLMKIFTTDSEMIALGSKALRTIVMLFPIVGFQFVGATLFQAVGKALPSLFLSLSRQILILIPLIIILPRYLGLTGIWISFPISDLLTGIITLILLMWQKKKFDIKIQQSELSGTD